MVYTVGEMARLLDVSASTLRYYDKEGLLPFVERSSGADAFCRNPPWRASQSIIPPIRLKKLIVVTGFAVRIWIWLLSQQKSVEFHARLIFLCMENCRKKQDFGESEGSGSIHFYEFIQQKHLFS